MSHYCKQSWLLIFFSCYLLCPLYTHSTPIQKRRGRSEPCAHASIAELIKTSPVILKALGAHIFTDDDLNELQATDGLQLKWQNGQNKYATSATPKPTGAAPATATTTTASAKTKTAATTTATTTWRRQTSNGAAGHAENGSQLPVTAAESILITLTPETIYKGASLLKMSPGVGSAARSSSGGTGGGSGSASGAAESAHQYEGSQLNATLEPLPCFDRNVLKMLPTELIAFGKLVTVQQQEQQQQLSDRPQPQQQTQQNVDILRISINGLHRWSPQFEQHIWKHLGWDDWSDFTLCSVTCGKGVQQRFRRCLLDNPLVNLNMNMNLNAIDEDDDDVEVDVHVADDDDATLTVADDIDVAPAAAADDDDDANVDSDVKNAEIAEIANVLSSKGSDRAAEGKNLTTYVANVEMSKDNVWHKSPMELGRAAVTVGDVLRQQKRKQKPSKRYYTKKLGSKGNGSTDDTQDAADDPVMRIYEAAASESAESESSTTEQAVSFITRRGSGSGGDKQIRKSRQHKRRKSTKSFSTMFCEGYNIEQRNCNTFECSDDISDLLKFYRKLPASEEAASQTASPPAIAPASTMDFNTSTTFVTATMSAEGGVRTTGSGGIANVVPAAASSNGVYTSTLSNMGYVHSWRNALNFTIMVTLRLKQNDSKTTATIFSVRNATHNLYLESCTDGLRLYLERDYTTEMLPVKFNLYDYRWHQVAISIQNGDFISIYVDCSWTNSFVVSKRLFSLPLDADVEIGRGFNGELQQLLVLPDNQERQQCSNKRTSINEVKRYIIDTFIDDYGN